MTTTRFGTSARLCGLALFCCTDLLAQIPDKLPALSFDQGRGTVEVVERLRYEDRGDTFDFDSATHSVTDGSWLVQRLRVGALWKAAPDWLVEVQLQDAREWGSDRPKVPFILGAEGNNALNLRLASVTWGDPKSPVKFTLGRQALVLGEERLVGIGDWNNFSRTFDAGKLVWTVVPAKTVLTAFVSSVVTMQPTTSGASWQLNRSSTDDLFSGIDLTQKLSADDTAEAYVLWRDKKNNDPIYTAPSAPIPPGARNAAAYDIAQDIYTIGGRIIRVPKAGALDGEFEAAYQGGHVDRQTLTFTGPYGGSAAKLVQDAWALHSMIGFTPTDAPAKLRVDVEYNIATGDTHRTDDKNGSFMNLFPSNHKFYGFMDVFAWKNMEEFVATLRCVPLPKTTLRLDYHVFSLFTTSDAWYRANAVATVRPLNAAARSASRDAGDEFDVTATWAFRAWANFDLGWSRFIAGSYLQGTGAHSDARFLYVQTTLKF